MKVRLKHRSLARELARRNLSLNHWGLKLGLSRGHLSLLVNGKRPFPTPRTRRKLLEGLKLHFDDLFEVVDEEVCVQPARRTVRTVPQAPEPRVRRGESLVETIRQDIRYARRSLFRRPVYALILILALGIGANTAIFSVLNGVLLQPLPFSRPERLVAVWDLLGTVGPGFSHLSGPEFVDLRAIGLARDGVSIEQVRSDLESVSGQLNREFSSDYHDKGFGMTAVPLAEQITGETRPALIALQATVGFLLLLVAVNLAALQLARAMSRQSEVAVRLDLGSGRWRLVRQFLAEALLAVVPGGLVGIGLAYLGLVGLRSLGHLGLPRLDQAGVDPRVLLFALAASLACALLFGMAPLAGISLRTSGRSLGTGSRAAVGNRSAWGIQQFLVTAQVALALMLVVGSGLMLRSLLRLQSVGPGF